LQRTAKQITQGGDGMTTVHIALAGSAAGNIRELIKARPAARLAVVDECFSIGPLFNITAPAGLQERKNYIKNLFEKTLQAAVFEDIQPHLGICDIQRIPKQADRFVVWCGANADEQILLIAVAAIFPAIPLNIPDVHGVSVKQKRRSAVGGCTLDELLLAEQRMFLPSPADRKNLLEKWAALVNDKAVLRVFSDGHVIGVEETVFDQMLNNFCPEEFGSAARLVGTVMGHSQIQITDTFLDYRLRHLIAKGDIEAGDPHQPLRFLQVRRARSAGRASSQGGPGHG
jgi:hypothetical protein